MNESATSRLRTLPRLLFWLFLPLVVGGLSGFITAGSVETWYLTIEKPSFNPPGWVFGPVWTVLYLMMGVAACLVFRGNLGTGMGGRVGGTACPPISAPVSRISSAKVAFLAQLALNGLWSVIFFGLHRPGWALIEIVVLWVAIGWTVRLFARVSRAAAWLLAPYWAWVSFAAVLNGAIWWLNR